MITMLLLVCFIPVITSACPLTLQEKYVRAGDMVALYCGDENCDHGDTMTLWKKSTDQETYLYSNMSAAEQREMGLLVFGNCLVILNASVNHQGSYSCDSHRNTSSQLRFMVTVYSTQSEEHNDRGQYPTTCYNQHSCTLFCPHDLAADIPNITNRSISWAKDGEPSASYFPAVEEKDSGVYTCTRSYLYFGKVYSMTFTVPLSVEQDSHGYSTITSPEDGHSFEVELGKTMMIDCKVKTKSSKELIMWLSDGSFVNDDDQSRVHYNISWSDDTRNVRATLVFKEVLEEDLSKNYTCKLQSDQTTQWVTITLTQKAHLSYISLAVCIVIIIAMTVITVVIYVKFKVDIILFLRNTLGCQCQNSDGKSYDAFVMCYQSGTSGGLTEDDRKWLESTLEERFGYSLCRYDRDILPGKAVAEAVLDCIEQSRTVILVPSSPDIGPDSSHLSAIHAALVERQTRLIFIMIDQAGVSPSGSFLEALHLLSEAGDCVTWKGRPPSSFFWKQLRYHLPAPQGVPKIHLFTTL